MGTRRIFSKPSPPEGRQSLLEWVNERASTIPQSVLFITPPDVDDETVVKQWEPYGSRTQLRLCSFRDIVDELYEADTYNGKTTFTKSSERRWIVEEALKRVNDDSHPLYTAEPEVGVITQAEELLTLLEFAGLVSAEDVEQRLRDVGVADLATSLATFVEHVHAVRDDHFSEDHTFRSERFIHALEAGVELLSETYPTVDVVAIGSFQTLSPLERDLIELLATAFDTGIVLTRTTTPTQPPSGTDEAISRIHSWYDELGFTRLEEADETTTTYSDDVSQRIVASLYHHQSTDELPTDRLTESLTINTHTTIQQEIRATASDVRRLINDGVDPSTIAIAVFDEETYGKPIADALAQADIPVVYSESQSFFATTTGKLIEAALNLGEEPTRKEPLVRLLSNPFVHPEATERKQTIIRQAKTIESGRVSELTEEVDPQESTLIEETVAASQEFVNATNVESARQELFATLGVPVENGDTQLHRSIPLTNHIKDRESKALSDVVKVCVSLTSLGNTESIDSETIRRAFEQITINVGVGRQSNSVRVCSPTEAVANQSKHVFVPGLTTEHTPSPPRRLAFARRLNEAHPDFAAADPIANTRYVFGQLLASESTLRLTAPERNANGDPYVPADVLVELCRVTGLKPKSRTAARIAPATRTDVHRSLAAALTTDSLTPEEVTDNAGSYDIAVPATNAITRMQSGVEVAAARAADAVGSYDGHIDSAVVTQLLGEDRPFSPSRLETYADCGFKFYLKYLLKIESEDEIPLELNALDAGTFVHDVLERFYRTWIERGHDGVTESTLGDAEQLLYDVAVDRLAELDTPATVFHDTWVADLFNGLSVSNNEFGDAEAPPGLFKRFLHAEIELAPRTAKPSYFEAHVGLHPDQPGPEVISTDPVRVPGTDARIHGKIDRLDITSDNGIVGIDYKTGSTPSEAETIDGHAFQLPAYLLMAADALDGIPIGGSYYQLPLDDTVSPHAGTIGGDSDAAHAYWGTDNPEPLRRYQSLEFDTREEFQTFLHETIPDRIERIADGVNAGSFHPTVLDPGTAGCEYCPYRDACDVRHHRRHEIHAGLVADETPSYAPGIDTEANQ